LNIDKNILSLETGENTKPLQVIIKRIEYTGLELTTLTLIA